MTRLHIKEHESRNVLAQSLEALKKTQANLIASKRAASQGRLAAAISHELNTPLSVLLSTSELVERYLTDLASKCGDPQAVERSVAEASRAAETSREALGRIVELVDRFERFTQLDAAERRLVDVNALLDDTAGVLSGGWREGVRVIKDFGDVPKVMAYPAGLSEVFSNVLNNAAGAIDGEGEIRLTTRYGRGYVWVQIADTGRGIDMDEMAAIFDPRFRVENGRVRTGWGLFISRQIIHDHHGEFRISSELEQGTEVEICLRADTEEAGE
jgi:signal transduction histidine kinase